MWTTGFILINALYWVWAVWGALHGPRPDAGGDIIVLSLGVGPLMPLWIFLLPVVCGTATKAYVISICTGIVVWGAIGFVIGTETTKRNA